MPGWVVNRLETLVGRVLDARKTRPPRLRHRLRPALFLVPMAVADSGSGAAVGTLPSRDGRPPGTHQARLLPCGGDTEVFPRGRAQRTATLADNALRLRYAAELVTEWRRARGLTQAGVARLARTVAPDTVNNLDIAIRPGNRKAILEALGIPAAAVRQPPAGPADDDDTLRHAAELVTEWLRPMAPDARDAAVRDLALYVVAHPGQQPARCPADSLSARGPAGHPGPQQGAIDNMHIPSQGLFLRQRYCNS